MVRRTRKQYHANNTNEAYSTGTHYEYSNRQLVAYIIDIIRMAQLLKLYWGYNIITAVGIYYSAYNTTATASVPVRGCGNKLV